VAHVMQVAHVTQVWDPALLWHFTDLQDACTEDVSLLSKFSGNQASATTMLCKL